MPLFTVYFRNRNAWLIAQTGLDRRAALRAVASLELSGFPTRLELI